MTDHDVPVDVIVTPTRTIRTGTRFARPRGVNWSLVTDDMVRDMPILAELRDRKKKAGRP